MPDEGRGWHAGRGLAGECGQLSRLHAARGGPRRYLRRGNCTEKEGEIERDGEKEDVGNGGRVRWGCVEGKNKESVGKGELLGAKTVQGKGVMENVWKVHRF